MEVDPMVGDLRSSSDESRDNGAYVRLWLRLILRNYVDGDEKRATVHFVGEIDKITVCDLKNRIEYMYKIPRFLQRLYYDDTLLQEEDVSLTENGVRVGNIVTVEYSTTADIDSMLEAVEFIILAMKLVEEQLSPGCTSTDIPQYFSADAPSNIYHIFREYCMGSSLRSRANREVFARNDGFTYLFALYRLLLAVDYALLPFYLRQLESWLVQMVDIALTSNTELPEVQKMILENSALEYTTCSFLRASVPPDKCLAAPSGYRDKMEIQKVMQDRVLASVLQLALTNLSNLAKVPALQLTMASNERLLTQLMAMVISPTYNSSTVVIALNTINNLARCGHDAHVYLTSPYILDGLLKAVKTKCPRMSFRQSMYSIRRHDHLILRQSMTTFFASLLSESSDILPLFMKLKMYAYVTTTSSEDNMDLMNVYMNGSTCTESIVWAFLSMAYSSHDLTNPQYSLAHNELMKNLKDYCLRFTLLNMHDEVVRKKNVVKDFIVDNELTNFLVCLPWYLTVDDNDKANLEAVMDIASDGNFVEVPTLLNLCRARLAKVWLGFQNAVKLSVHEIVIKWTNCDSIYGASSIIN